MHRQIQLKKCLRATSTGGSNSVQVEKGIRGVVPDAFNRQNESLEVHFAVVSRGRGNSCGTYVSVSFEDFNLPEKVTILQLLTSELAKKNVHTPCMGAPPSFKFPPKTAPIGVCKGIHRPQLLTKFRYSSLRRMRINRQCQIN